MSTTETNEQGDDLSSSTETEIQRRPRRGGKGGHHKREEPTSLTELQACPLAVSCFQHMACYQFCERLSHIQHHRGLNRRRPGDPLPKDRELLLIRANWRLEGLLDKANRDKELLRNMKTHYWARLHVCKARMKILQRKLSEARKRKKRTNPLRILAKASLTHHSTDQP